MFGVIKYLSQVITKFDDIIAGSSPNEKENAYSPNVPMFSPKGEVIYEKSSSETLFREVSIKKLKKLAPESNSEENLEGLKIIRFVVSVVAYLLQVAQRQGHM